MFLKKFPLFLLLAIIAVASMAQSKNDYSANWKKVAAFEEKGLTKSALQEVLTIYQLALNSNNEAQQIKSAMYQVKYRNSVEEDSREKNILFVDTLVNRAKSPAKNVLLSMQAEMYRQYLQNNRYKLYNRTQLSEENSKDIRTWSLAKLHATISRLYRNSLDNELLLKSTRLDGFEPIIQKGENTRNLRPTLFDFLAHRALEYFMNDERDLLKPAYHFTIHDPLAFAPVAEFVKVDFKTSDTTSLHHHALLLFQSIMKFHLTDGNTNALLDADLSRLHFVHRSSVLDNKNQLFEDALKKMEAAYNGNAGIAQAMYLRARLYFEKGQQYQPFNNTANQYEIKRAKELCDETIQRFPGSEGAINSHNLLSQLLQPSINLQTEKVNLPNQPFRTFVKYKNVKTLYLRLVKTSKEDLRKIDRRNFEKSWQNIVALKPTISWTVALPDGGDYQAHSTEIKVDGVANGMYFLLASVDAGFALEKNIMARQLTHISNISYIHNANNEYNVLHRETGQPMANTTVQVWETKYDYNTGQNEEVKAESYTANKNGYFKMPLKKAYRSFVLQLINKDDELFLDENNYSPYYNSYPETQTPLVFLFTDRSIYRPGQMIYFKGIVLKKDSIPAESAVLQGFASTLVLKDVNGQKIDEIKTRSNEYGSYHGSFKLPEGLLNGQFSLFDESTGANHFFNVEEYKRPAFTVDIPTPAGSYRLHDSIKVTGTAKAYAGNNISDAAVKYRVIRKVRYPIWWGSGYFRNSMPRGRSTESVEIANGQSATNASGEFTITFKAIPDESVSKEDQPTFYYEVNADVTDLNGETRSAETTIAVGYQAIQLTIDLPEKITADSLKNLMIRSVNTNGLYEQARVHVTMHAIQSPGKLYRKRYWEIPDQFVMTKDQYHLYFPHDAYQDEDQVAKWPLGNKLIDHTDSTNAAGRFSVGNSIFKPGWYKIVATTTDKYGEPVEAIKFIFIGGNVGEKPAETFETPISLIVKDERVEPGQKVQYNIRTGLKKIWLVHTISKMNQTSTTSYLQLKSGEAYHNEIDITEQDRGGLSVSYAFVQHNRVYNGEEVVTIPWDNKALKISYQTFRDKLLPGSKEKWTAKITGNKGEKIAAEMLVSMYDASLDQFKSQNWSTFNIWPNLRSSINWAGAGFKSVYSEEYNKRVYNYLRNLPKSYDRLLQVFSYFGFDDVVIGYGAQKKSLGRVSEEAAMSAAPVQDIAMNGEMREVALENGNAVADSTVVSNQQSPAAPPMQVRKNFNETAFFYPDLTTDSTGAVSFSFTMPEALTQWKLMTFAHTKALASGYLEQTVVTQKPLMVQPNAPRFVREGDRMEFITKVVNLSDKEVTGTAQLELLDAATNKPVDGWLKNIFPNQYFTIAPGASQAVKFPIEIPFNYNTALTYRITARSKGTADEGETGFSDGEEMALPVLTNRILVTESMPLNLRNTSQKDFRFDKLLRSGSSSSLSNHALTVEFTSNPAWYAVQALPYLMEYPYDCSEQVFNRFYANTLATHVTNALPKVKAVFEKWKNSDSAALLSNLQKNSELKAALLQETPWVLNALDEAQQKKNIALLFDLSKMSSEQARAINKLKEMQSPNGGFVWFKGGPDDRYITQYILTGIGHLRKLNALPVKNYSNIQSLIDKAILYLDNKIKDDYDNLVKNKAILKNNQLSYTSIQYLYMRSFFNQHPIPAASQKAYTYYRGQAIQFWLNNSRYMQAMIALALHRTNDQTTPRAIIASLKQNSINNEELGMYWKDWTSGGYYWYQAPIESQALMIEAFTDIDKNVNTINDLKTWLLKQKQTQHWRTTKATSEACYAMLLNGSDWLSEEKEVVIQLGNTNVNNRDEKGEAGTGYFKKTLAAEKITPAMGNISVTTHSVGAAAPTAKSVSSWGAVYWQYFEDLDKVTSAATPLKLTKQLFIEKNTDKGPVLELVQDGASLRVGDKIKVRIELRADRDMEYVHMKDMRAACMEPVNVISGYKYQGGLGYYESTKDASTNFFFGRLTRGSYVFEYPVFVTHTGNFSNGITTIQCMYAPEFTSHSEGIRVMVEAP